MLIEVRRGTLPAELAVEVRRRTLPSGAVAVEVRRGTLPSCTCGCGGRGGGGGEGGRTTAADKNSIIYITALTSKPACLIVDPTICFDRADPFHIV